MNPSPLIPVGTRVVEFIEAAVAQSAARYLAAGVPVGDCLADQLFLPLALAGGGSYKTLALTRHFATNVEIIQKFLHVMLATREAGPDATAVEVR
jgi:RNA 3'-terminal phosphate cyclase (ATP)